MTARGRTHQADPFVIELPFLGAGAHGPHRARGVLQHDWMPVAGGAEAIFQNNSRNALLVQPTRILTSLMVRQSAVAAAGTDDDGCAARFGGGGQERREGRNVLVLL